jgi:cytochrome b561
MALPQRPPGACIARADCHCHRARRCALCLYGRMVFAAAPHAGHTLLWDAHFYLVFAFFAVIPLHVAGALFHALVRRDGVFEAMASLSIGDEAAPTE